LPPAFAERQRQVDERLGAIAIGLQPGRGEKTSEGCRGLDGIETLQTTRQIRVFRYERAERDQRRAERGDRGRGCRISKRASLAPRTVFRLSSRRAEMNCRDHIHAALPVRTRLIAAALRLTRRRSASAPKHGANIDEREVYAAA